LDSLLIEAYAESAYASVVMLYYTDRENRAMASVFSSSAASFHGSSDPHDQLTQSSHPRYYIHFPRHILNAGVTVELIYLFIGTLVRLSIRNSSHLFMERRRIATMSPRRNQGGFYDVLQQVETGSSHADARVGHHRLCRAEQSGDGRDII
jgi:hypothetical protein